MQTIVILFIVGTIIYAYRHALADAIETAVPPPPFEDPEIPPPPTPLAVTRLRVRELEGELESMTQTFETIYAAQMRAVNMWRQAGPGRELTLPDWKQLTTWLLDQLEEVKQEREQMRRALDLKWGDDTADHLRMIAATLNANAPICIGRPIIQHLARDGQWISDTGAAVIAADELFRNDPYERLQVAEDTLSQIAVWRDNGRAEGRSDTAMLDEITELAKP